MTSCNLLTFKEALRPSTRADHISQWKARWPEGLANPQLFKRNTMQLIIINSKTFEEYSVTIPDREGETLDSFKVLAGEQVYTLSPTVDNSVLQYRRMLQAIIGTHFAELIERYPITDPSQITDEFKSKIAAEFDAIVEKEMAEYRELYKTMHDRAVNDLTITFLNGSAASAKYREIQEIIRKNTKAKDYTTDYIQQILAFTNPDTLPSETIDSFLRRMSEIIDCMIYDERPHLGMFSDDMARYDETRNIFIKATENLGQEDRFTRLDEKNLTGLIKDVVASLLSFSGTLHDTAKTEKESIESMEKLLYNYKAEPNIVYLLAAKSIAVKFINATNDYVHKIQENEQTGNSSMNSSTLLEYKRVIATIFRQYDIILIVESRDERPRNEKDTGVARSTLHAIRKIMHDQRNSGNPNWFVDLSNYFYQNLDSLFGNIVPADNAATTTETKADQ